MSDRLTALLERLGIVRNAIKRDLLFFYLPWLTVFYLELQFCRKYGDGLSGIWETIWSLFKHTQNLLELPWHQAIGLALFISGLTIMIVSQVTLWENYSGFLVIRKDHRLITYGIYHFIRHPIYFGALIAFVSLPLYAASLYGLLTMIFLIPIFLNRIRLEEQLLTEEFQDAYQKYKENSKALIPFIY
jgi:protein-S-isoprenylcysteine O-methyltransferase Ste14